MKMNNETPIAPKVLTQVQSFKEHLSIGKEKYKSDIFEYRWKRIKFYLNSINAALGREISIVSKVHKSSEEIEYMFNVFVNGEYDVLASFEIMNDRDYFLQLLEERYELDLETHLVKQHGLEWSRELNDYVNKNQDS
jgi:hypothetical protein